MNDFPTNGNLTQSTSARSVIDWFRLFYPDHRRALSTGQKIRRTLANPRTWARKVKNALLNVRHVGRFVKKKHGIGYSRQLAEQLWLDWAYGLSIHNYYTYRLYRRSSWKRAEDYLPTFSELHEQLVARTTPEERNITENKLHFFRHCEEHGIPTIPAIAEITREGASPVDSFNLPPQCDIFVKPRDGMKGLFATSFRYENDHYVDVQGDSWTWEELTAHLMERAQSGRSFLIQPVLENHTSWQPFTSGALSTLRLMTARRPEDGQVVPLRAKLRMPTGDAIVDNVAAGSLVSPLDLETGRLGRIFIPSVTPHLEGHATHPDTGARIPGEVLPEWRAVLRTALDAHESFDMIFIGWDIALTTEGIRVVEANADWGIGTYQRSHGIPVCQTRFARMYEAWMQNSRPHNRA